MKKRLAVVLCAAMMLSACGGASTSDKTADTKGQTAADSKAELAANTLVPYATVEGTKGGSPIAAAVVNAIMYIIDNNRD